MKYDTEWLSFEQLNEIFWLDWDAVDEAVETERLKTRVVERKNGSLIQYSRQDATDLFPLRDRQTLRRIARQDHLMAALISACVGVGANELSGWLKSRDTQQKKQSSPSSPLSESLPPMDDLFVSNRWEESIELFIPFFPQIVHRIYTEAYDTIDLDCQRLFLRGARNITRIFGLGHDIRRLKRLLNGEIELKVVRFPIKFPKLIVAIRKHHPDLSDEEIAALLMMIGSDKRFD